MKIVKNVSVIILTLCLLLVSSGCSSFNLNESKSEYTESIKSNNGEFFQNHVVPIYNASNEEIGSIDCYGYSVLAKDNILYVRLPENASSTGTLEYCLYDVENEENYQLITINDWYYEAIYDTLEVDDHLYLSVSTGSLNDFENGKQTIYDVSLSEHSMKPLLEIEGGVPYNSYTVANGKLVVAELLYNGNTDLVTVDLNEQHNSTTVHTYDETEYFVDGSIRHIYADDNYIYTIRLTSNESETDFFLYLDKYNFNFDLLDSIDLRDFCVSTYIDRTEDSKINEWKQFVSYFFVHNNLVYYQNFSTTNAIGVLDNDHVDRLFETNSRFSYVSSSYNDKYDLFIQTFGKEAQDRNIFYRVNSETHRIEIAEFFADNRDYTFVNAFRDNNKILLTMGYVSNDNSERLPNRLYYIDMNDLDFKPMD